METLILTPIDTEIAVKPKQPKGKNSARLLTAKDFDLNTVYETTAYDAFSRIKGNRPYDDIILAQLRQSMENKALVAPILVNDKFEIINGQHRWFVIKELKLPLFFLMRPGYGHEQMIRFNSITKNWKMEDYLSLYVSQGLEEYIRLQNYMNEYDLSVNVATSMLTNILSLESFKRESLVSPHRDRKVRLRVKAFEMGNFRIMVSEEDAKCYGDHLRDIQGALLKTSVKAPEYIQNEAFIKGLVNICRSPKYDHALMLGKIHPDHSSYHMLIDRLASCPRRSDEYSILLEKIYNLNQKQSTTLYVSLAQQKAAKENRRLFRAEQLSKGSKSLFPAS